MMKRTFWTSEQLALWAQLDGQWLGSRLLEWLSESPLNLGVLFENR